MYEAWRSTSADGNCDTIAIDSWLRAIADVYLPRVNFGGERKKTETLKLGHQLEFGVENVVNIIIFLNVVCLGRYRNIGV